MKQRVAAVIVAALVLSISAFGGIEWRGGGGLTKSAADAFYCKLTGCTMTGVFSPAFGTAANPGISFAGTNNGFFYTASGNHLTIRIQGVNTADVNSSAALVAAAGYPIGWASTVDATGTIDLQLMRGAAGALRQINTTNAQLFEIFNTSDSSSSPTNYEKLVVGANPCGIGANELGMIMCAGGTGSARHMWVGTNANSGLFLRTNSTDWIKIDESGHYLPQADKARNLGSATARLLNGYILNLLGGTESGSNTAGTSTIIGSDTGTGNTTPTSVRIQVPAQGTGSGSTVHTLVERAHFNYTKTLTNNSSTAIANFTAASNTGVGAVIDYTIEVSDGGSNHMQHEAGSVICNVINQNGTFSQGGTSGCTKYGNQQVIGASGGTLTVTWTMTAANPAVLTLNSNTGTITPAAGYPRVTAIIRPVTQQAVAYQ